MAELAPVETLTSVIPLASTGLDVFTNENSLWATAEGARGIFGGFLIAHSVNAAKKTVPQSFHVHSLQSSFLRPGDGREKIVYKVERLTDGRSFATRLVHALQGDTNIFVATVSFQKTGSIPDANALRYEIPMPDMGGLKPEDVSDEAKQEALSLIGLTPEWLSRHPPDPFDWRFLPVRKVEDPTLSRILGFVRSSHRFSSDDPSVHLGGLGFMSDEWLIGSLSLASQGVLGPGLTLGTGAASVLTSMNHTTFFHSTSARADQWMVFERKTSWAANGRALVEQRFWNCSDGRLVKSSFQEGLVRLRNANL